MEFIDFENIVLEALNESVYIVEGGNKKIDTSTEEDETGDTQVSNKAVKDIRSKITNHLIKKQKDDKKFQDALSQSSVSMDYTPNTNAILRLNSQGIADGDIENDVKDAIAKLRLYTTNGAFNGKFQQLSQEEKFDLEKMKRFVDLSGLNFLYDKTAPRGSHEFGLPKNDTIDYTTINLDSLNLRDILASSFYNADDPMYNTDADIRDRKARGYETILKRYVATKYGVGFSVPGFAIGNKKLKKTLIVNFASATGCPAWKECIVRHACYARSIERGVNGLGVFGANEKKRLLWLTATYDMELKELLINYLKATAINYEWMWEKFNDKIKAELISLENFIEMPLSEWSDEIKSFFKTKKGFSRVNDIRFNENGDFLSQDILQMADDIAGEFKTIGIYASAYTCRRLNYDNIKNIILNGSQDNLNIGDEGSQMFARLFYALPGEVWSSIPSTWSGFSSKQIVITPLTSNNGKTAIYKCPCKKDLFNKEIHCGHCHYCYEPKQEGFDKIYVLVEAHGGAKNKLDATTTKQVLSRIGKFDNIVHEKAFINNLLQLKNEKNSKFIDNVINDYLKEGIEFDTLTYNMDEAIDIICNNAIYSMNNIVENMTMVEESKKVAKDNFNMILEKISKK